MFLMNDVIISGHCSMDIHITSLPDTVTLVDMHIICNVFRNVKALLVDVNPRFAVVAIKPFAVNAVRTLGNICVAIRLVYISLGHSQHPSF